MQIRLSARNLELLEMEWVELKNKSINEYYENACLWGGGYDSIKKDLAFIKELLVSMKSSGYVNGNLPSPYNPLIIAPSLEGNSWFIDDVKTNGWNEVKPKSRFDLKQWGEVWLTDKQKTFVDYRIWMVIDRITWAWFNWGWVKNFDDLEEVWELKWDAYLYAKDYIKHYVENNTELDYTCFRF